MPPPITASHLRASVFRLPPSLRSSLYANVNASSRRAFSASSPRKDAANAAVTLLPTAVLDTLHTVLPWSVTIPLTAVLVRGVLGYYLIARPQRQNEIFRRALYPLIRVKTRQTASMARHKARTQPKIPKPLAALRDHAIVLWHQFSHSNRISNDFSVPVLSWRAFANFGLLITFSEAIRIKCGLREGLLPLFLTPFEGLKDRLQQMQTPPTPPISEPVQPPIQDPHEALAERLFASLDAQKSQQSSSAFDWGSPGPDPLQPVTTPSAPTPPQDYHLTPINKNAYADQLDPTLQTENFAWITDLTVPDPSLILPLSFSAVLASSVMLRPREKIPDPPLPKPKPTSNEFHDALASADKLSDSVSKRKSVFENLNLGQRLGLSMSILFFFVGLKLPAAMLLYIIPSMFIGWAQSRWLDYKHPLPPVIEPCRTPIRLKVRATKMDV